MNRTLLLLAAWWLAAPLAHAETPAAEPSPPPASAVPAWLELQRSGEAASPQAQPLSGPAMERVHLRYLKGFEHPQPMYFKHDQNITPK